MDYKTSHDTLTSAVDAGSVAVSTLTFKAAVDVDTDAFTTDTIRQTLVCVYTKQTLYQLQYHVPDA